MPSREHVCYNADGLNTKRISVDLGLGKMVGMMLEPEKEVVLEGKGFNGGTDRGPEEKNPTSLNVSCMAKSITRWPNLQDRCHQDSLDKGEWHDVMPIFTNGRKPRMCQLFLISGEILGLGTVWCIREIEESKNRNGESDDAI